MDKKTHVGITILRLSLSFVFLWFAFSQLSNTAQWTSIVPTWAQSIAPAGTLVILNAFFEIFSGIMLALGVYTRFFATILAIHLFMISFSLGLNPIGVRDFGLTFSLVGLTFLGGGRWALTYKKTEETL
jgi:uncharacterized membrane protein YphA (DoxX/SURF4 family)